MSNGNPDITNTYLYYKKAHRLIQHALHLITQRVSREEFSSIQKEIINHEKGISGGITMVGRAAAYMQPIKELVKYFDPVDADHLLSDLHSRLSIWIKVFNFNLWQASHQPTTYKPRIQDNVANPEGSDMENSDDEYDPEYAGSMNNPTSEQRQEFQRKHAFFFHNTTLKLYFMNRAIARAERHAVGDNISETILKDLEIYNSIAQLATEYFFENDESFPPNAEPIGHPLMLRIFFRTSTKNGSIFMCPFPSPIDPIPLWPMVASEILAEMRINGEKSTQRIDALIDILGSVSPVFAPTRQATLIFTTMSRFARVQQLLETIATEAARISKSSHLGKSRTFQFFALAITDTAKSAKQHASLLHTPT